MKVELRKWCLADKKELKNGFIQEGVMRKAVIKGGIIYDIFLYGLLK